MAAIGLGEEASAGSFLLSGKNLCADRVNDLNLFHVIFGLRYQFVNTDQGLVLTLNTAWVSVIKIKGQRSYL